MKPKIVIGVIIIVIALTVLIYSGIQDKKLYYVTVAELFAQGRSAMDKGLRVSGYVIPETIKWDSGKNVLYFSMAEGTDTLRVVYNKVMPDQLADAQQVVAEGKLDQNGLFRANSLLLKCPSKYEVADNEEKS